MSFLRIAALVVGLTLTLSTAGLAQRGGRGGGGGRGGFSGGRGGAPSQPSPPKIGDISSALLNKISLTKTEKDTVKKLEDAFKAQEKTVTDSISAAKKAAADSGGSGSSTASGGGGRGGRGGGGRGGYGRGGAGTTNSALTAVHESFITALRPVLTDEQAKQFDANLAAWRAKLQDAQR